nr:embryo-specific protein ATS3B-like isoform X2 [Cicer arietinum]
MVTRDKPQINQPSMLNDINSQSSSCNYLVTIKTSCDSPLNTTDQIDIVFGDADGSEVFSPRLDEPDSGAFEQCTTVSFEIEGKCLNKICKLYLYRRGSDGWLPELVTAYDYLALPVPFYYNTDIPDDGVGYGFDYCA